IAMACGGGDDKSKNTGGSGSSGAQTGSATPGKDSGAAQPTVTPVAATTAGCFANLNTFRYTSTTSLKTSGGQGAPGGDSIKASGSFQAPNRFQSKIEGSDQTAEVILIGEDVYVKEGTNPWEKSPAGGPGGLNIKPSDLCQKSGADLEKAG